MSIIHKLFLKAVDHKMKKVKKEQAAIDLERFKRTEEMKQKMKLQEEQSKQEYVVRMHSIVKKLMEKGEYEMASEFIDKIDDVFKDKERK